MSNIVRAWKDEEYRQSLSASELALLPENPAGSLELTDDELDVVAGASRRGRIKVKCAVTVIACYFLTIVCEETFNFDS
jgi:mersacidin/lichenicidin family type 2 lantibiotic